MYVTKKKDLKSVIPASTLQEFFLKKSKSYHESAEERK